MKMKTIKNFLSIFTLIAAIFVTGCSEDDTTNPVPPDQTIDVKVTNNPALGDIITDDTGLTLYFFSKDVAGESACEGDCVAKWPIFYRKDLKVAAGLEAGLFGVITRADGSKQNTFNGWPLYYFANDKAEGDVNGEGVGAVWFVAKTNYSLMHASTQLIGQDGISYKEDYTPGEEATGYLTDAAGITLYTFINDSKDKNNFTNEDFSNDPVWPIFHIDLEQIPSIYNLADFGEIDVFGRKQLTYKGWPLYTFGGDADERGSNKGVSVPAPGVWPIVNNTILPAE